MAEVITIGMSDYGGQSLRVLELGLFKEIMQFSL